MGRESDWEQMQAINRLWCEAGTSGEPLALSPRGIVVDLDREGLVDWDGCSET